MQTTHSMDPMDWVRRIEGPRFPGSAGEAKTHALLHETLDRRGWSVREPMVPIAHGVAAWGRILVAAAVASGGLARAALEPRLGWLAWPAAAILAAGLLLLRAMARRPLRFAGGARVSTVNLIARPPGASDAPPRLVLMAHYDSKSQSLPFLVRSFLTMGAIALAGLLTAAAFVAPAEDATMPAWTGVAADVGIAALAVVALPLLFLRSHDRSPGAADNASGVATLLAALPDMEEASARLALAVVFTGAEELGMLGADAYAAAWPPDVPRPAVLNLDTVGFPGPWLAVGGRRGRGSLRRRLADAAKGAGRLVRLPAPPGYLADHIPLCSRGMDAVTVSSASPRAWHLHSPRDSSARLDPAALRAAAQLVRDVVRAYATENGES